MACAGDHGAKDIDLKAIADTACSRAVAGHDWFEKYCKVADSLGIPVEVENECEKFRFGASRIHESTFRVWAKCAVEGKPFAVKVAVVVCKVPLLFSRNVLSRLGTIYHLETGVADFERLQVRVLHLGVFETGHPTLEIGNFGRSLEVARSPVHSSSWALDPEIRFPAVEVAYMSSAAVGSGKSDTVCHPIFYPKKVSKEVQSMLSGSGFSAVSFYQWWKGAAQSRDFWIETPNELVRIHVVPRITSFSPGAWRTNNNALHAQLMEAVGEGCFAEAIPCSGEGVFLHEVEIKNWKEITAEEVGEIKKHGLWIGRSRFPRRSGLAPLCATSVPNVCAPDHSIAMEDESPRVDSGARALGSGGSPKLDCSGAAGNGGGTKERH